MYADLHTYPAAFAYDHVRMQDEDKGLPKHPWAIPPSSPNQLGKPTGQAGYSQADLAKCIRSNTRLLFASLSPIEKGFFTGVDNSIINKEFILELHDRWHNQGEESASEWLLRELAKQPGNDKLKYRDIQFLYSRSMNLKPVQVKKLQNGHYDYFEELKNEYSFFLERSGQPSTTTYDIKIDTKGIARKWQGYYTLAASGKEINIDQDNNGICIVPTLGGIHSLGIGNPEDYDINSQSKIAKDVNLATVKNRIRQLKGEEPLDNGPISRWQHRPFYITFAQHFFNRLCGHAKSFQKPAQLLFNQEPGIDLGVLPGCYDIWKELLGLSNELEETGSSRILIDVRYMSPAARLAYYKNIVQPHNKLYKENPIPVIASHAAYTGVDYLQHLIERNKGNASSDYVNGFLAWNINLTDEDIIQIFASQGLLGLSLDNFLLGGGQVNWLQQLGISSVERKRALNLIKRTLQQFVRIPFEYQLHDPHTIWNRIALGSGFDGFMQPLQRYSSVLQFETLEEDLIKILSEMKREDPIWFSYYRPEDLARMICFDNALQFVKKHY